MEQKEVKQTRQSYSDEFRDKVLEVWYSGVYATVPECAKSYGIKISTLHNWIHRERVQPKTEESAEIKRLKKELARSNMELEILKKAAIYFASHTK